MPNLIDGNTFMTEKLKLTISKMKKVVFYIADSQIKL